MAVVKITAAQISHIAQHQESTPPRRTPADVERARDREALRYDGDDLRGRDRLEREQERLQRRSADAEEDEDVDDEELVVPRHDTVVQRRQRGDRVRAFRDQHCRGDVISHRSSERPECRNLRSKRGMSRDSSATSKVGMKD